MESPKNPDKSLELFKQGASILENALSGLNDIELDYSSHITRTYQERFRYSADGWCHDHKGRIVR